MRKSITVALLALLFCCHARADIYTIGFTNSGSASFSVPPNTLAQVLSYYTRVNSQFIVTVGGASSVQTNNSPFFFQNIVCPTVTGPATITLTNGSPAPTNTLSFFVVQTSPAIPVPVIQTPSTAVVIPSDTNGPVTIILESSTDLVNWTAALPGTYGTTSSNRFFRVRASR